MSGITGGVGGVIGVLWNLFHPIECQGLRPKFLLKLVALRRFRRLQLKVFYFFVRSFAPVLAELLLFEVELKFVLHLFVLRWWVAHVEKVELAPVSL